MAGLQGLTSPASEILSAASGTSLATPTMTTANGRQSHHSHHHGRGLRHDRGRDIVQSHAAGITLAIEVEKELLRGHIELTSTPELVIGDQLIAVDITIHGA